MSRFTQREKIVVPIAVLAVAATLIGAVLASGDGEFWINGVVVTYGRQAWPCEGPMVEIVRIWNTGGGEIPQEKAMRFAIKDKLAATGPERNPDGWLRGPNDYEEHPNYNTPLPHTVEARLLNASITRQQVRIHYVDPGLSWCHEGIIDEVGPTWEPWFL